MAHKKGVSSSKNGRESSYLVARLARLVTSSYVREVLSSILVRTSVWVATTLCMHWLTEQFSSRLSVKTGAL